MIYTCEDCCKVLDRAKLPVGWEAIDELKGDALCGICLRDRELNSDPGDESELTGCRDYPGGRC